MSDEYEPQDAYSLGSQDEGGPYAHYANLVKSCPEHAHLLDGHARVHFLMVRDEVVMAGRMVLGAVHLPRVQGRLKGVFDWMLASLLPSAPDFLVLLDRGYWMSGSERDREILIYHEMCHCVQAVDKEGDPRYTDDGDAVWALRGHDVEEFEATVRRYGAYSDELKSFIQAVKP